MIVVLIGEVYSTGSNQKIIVSLATWRDLAKLSGQVDLGHRKDDDADVSPGVERACQGHSARMGPAVHTCSLRQ